MLLPARGLGVEEGNIYPGVVTFPWFRRKCPDGAQRKELRELDLLSHIACST